MIQTIDSIKIVIKEGYDSWNLQKSSTHILKLISKYAAVTNLIFQFLRLVSWRFLEIQRLFL